MLLFADDAVLFTFNLKSKQTTVQCPLKHNTDLIINFINGLLIFRCDMRAIRTVHGLQLCSDAALKMTLVGRFAEFITGLVVLLLHNVCASQAEAGQQ